MGKVHFGAVLGHMHVPPASLRFDEEKEIPGAVALVFVIKALWLSRLCRQREPGFFDQLLARLIEVDLRTCVGSYGSA